MPVECKRQGCTERICFSGEKANALDSRTLADLALAFETAAGDSQVHVIGLESAGDRAFCAGASFDEMKGLSSLEDAEEFFLGFSRVLLAMAKAPQFVVARVHGKVVGGGIGLVAAADFSLASPDAEVRLSELSIGLGPLVIGPFVERKLGKSAFQTLAIETTPKPASWAAGHGLFNRLLPSRHELEAEYAKELSRLENLSPDAVRETKQIFWEDISELEVKSATRAKTVAALLMKARQ